MAWCRIARTVLAAGLLAFGGCATTNREPPNLQPLKRQVRAYVEGGDYLRDIEMVAARAKAWIEQRAARGGAKLAVVFDLDETLFFNWPYLKAVDFGYVHREWERWIEEAKAPAIEPVQELYRAARRLGFGVILITGRPESARAATERNLRGIGCADYAALICKGNDDRGTSAAFKTEARRRLFGEGWAIIANIGDQESDLAGGFSEQTFKLPNPFYLTE